MKTPTYHTLTIGAGAYAEIRGYARFVRLVSITGAATVRMAFDNDALQTFQPGISIDCEDQHWTRILFYNPAGVAVTVVLLEGDTRVLDDSQDSAAMAATLTSILARLAGVATMTQGVVQTLAATGGAGDLIFAANANRRRVVIEASLANVGYVYLGNAVGNCSDADCFAMLAPGQSWSDDFYTGAIYGVGSDATQQITRYQV